MNIWGILEYTASVTIVGLLIWLVKLIFHDKLDARWHYFIWLVLLVRLAVPVHVRFIPTSLSVFQEIPVGKWVEMGRILAEKRGYGSLADGLFHVYLWGAALLGAFYLITWGVLRIQIGRSPRADEATRAYVDGVAAKYGLKSCGDIRVRPCASPYVCGILHPILVLPGREEQISAHPAAEKETGTPANSKADFPGEGASSGADMAELAGSRAELPEEVIVHELLHRQYKDVWVNLAVHGVRAANWFNPFIWLLTANLLRDGEALCDQRVLERCGRERARKYGELLIAMGEGRGNRIKVGTSNMAGSYRNMRTRLRRIRDFGGVPKRIGLATLCITIILAVAGVGSLAQEARRFEVPEVDSLKSLEKGLLYAQAYHAGTPQEAVYLFLRAYEEGNTLYRMAVMPEAEIPRYEEFAREWFERQDITTWAELSQEGDFPAYFPEATGLAESYGIYNMRYDETAGSATVCAVFPMEQEAAFAKWRLSLRKEEGWKVWLEEDSGIQAGEYRPEPLLYGSARLGDFLIESSAYNEGQFNQLGNLGRGAGYWVFWNGEDRGEEEEFPAFFSVEYKYREFYVTYLGEESLEGRKVKVVVGGDGNADFDWDPAQIREMAGDVDNVGATGGGGPVDRVVSVGGSERNAYDSGSYGDSQGNGGAIFDGTELMTGKPKLVYGAGSSFSQPGYCWKEDDKMRAYVRIYVDDVLAEEGEVWSVSP